MHVNFSLSASTALVTAALCLAGPAVAQTLEGEWTNTPAWCGRYLVNNDNIRIKTDGYTILESHCGFAGGTRFSAQHWVMKGRCSGEGPDPPGPEITIELRSQGGKLRVDVGGKTFAYAQKCG